MSRNKNVPSSCSSMTRKGSFTKHSKTYLKLSYSIKDTKNLVHKNLEGITRSNSYERYRTY